jgi:hypothetical protein
MPAWIPPRLVPGLVKGGATPTGAEPFDPEFARSTDKDESLPDRLCRSAHSSRPWVVFVAISIWMYAGLATIGGMWMLILGARVRATSLVAFGIFSLIGALNQAIHGYLLGAYIARLRSLQYSPKSIVLAKVHDSLRAYWIYVAINLIIALVLISFFVIWAFAEGVTLPDRFFQ